MELIIEGPEELDADDIIVAELDGNTVFMASGGMMFLRKADGDLYAMNDTETADPVAFLEDVRKYNL